jgi:hypothetical protein
MESSLVFDGKIHSRTAARGGFPAGAEMPKSLDEFLPIAKVVHD